MGFPRLGRPRIAPTKKTTSQGKICPSHASCGDSRCIWRKRHPSWCSYEVYQKLWPGEIVHIPYCEKKQDPIVACNWTLDLETALCKPAQVQKCAQFHPSRSLDVLIFEVLNARETPCVFQLCAKKWAKSSSQDELCTSQQAGQSNYCGKDKYPKYAKIWYTIPKIARHIPAIGFYAFSNSIKSPINFVNYPKNNSIDYYSISYSLF